MKITCYVQLCELCVHLCNCLILLVSGGFKTSRTMFTQRGKVCSLYENITSLLGANLDLAFSRTKDQGNKAKLWDFRPLAVKVAAKYCISLDSISICLSRHFCFGLQQERLCKTDLSGLKLSVSIANPCSKLLHTEVKGLYQAVRKQTLYV